MDNSTSNSNNSSNSVKSLENISTISNILLIFIAFLSIIVLILLFNKNLFTGSDNLDSKISSTVFVSFLFLFLVVGLIVLFIPNFKEFKNLLYEIRSILYIVLYTLFLILFFSFMSKDVIEKYAYIITPITILITILIFYKGFSVDFIKSFNINYERIKTIILFFCLNVILLIFYNVDPGGYIKKYFGYSLILTILLSLFSFLYLIIVLSLPDKIKAGDSKKNFLENFSTFSIIGTISFIIFLIIVTSGIASYPGGFFKDKYYSIMVIILLIIIFTIGIIILVSNLFSGPDNNNSSDKLNIFKKTILTLLGLSISGILIAWLVYNIQNYSGQSGTISLILNVLIVALVLTLIYRTFVVRLPDNKQNIKKNSFFNLIINLILYIPCLLSGIFSNVFNIGSSKNVEINTNYIILLVIILLIILYLIGPIIYSKIYDKINLQGGLLLLNEPIYTDHLSTLSSYEKLNDSDDFNYQYGISSWIYIDAQPPNTNPSYTIYTSLLNYGNKPNILYKASTNTLLITIENNSPLPTETKNTKNIKNIKNADINTYINIDKEEEIINGKAHKIIYKNSNFLLQKWNNLVINYNGGTLDIFLNNELVKSSIEIVPYMSFDSLTVGETEGIHGGICNVVYFKKPLTRSNMYFLYNMVKDKTPPITNEKVNVEII